jgi:hypothetical protein
MAKLTGALSVVSSVATILEHIPKRARSLKLSITDEIKLTDHVHTIEVRSIIPSRVRFGTGIVVREEPEES